MQARVVLGVPHIGDFRSFFLESFINVASTPPGAYSFIHAERRPVDIARNEIVRSFLEDTDGTHLFFMDSDMVFPREALSRLLSRDKDIVGGLYFARGETPLPHVYQFHHDDGEGRWYRTMIDRVAVWLAGHPPGEAPDAYVYPDSPDALIEADALGAGCMLIKRNVLEAIAAPWFTCHAGTAAGEDFNFCALAKRHGFEVWADLSVHCSHEAQRVMVSAKDFAEVFCGEGMPAQAVLAASPGSVPQEEA